MATQAQKIQSEQRNVPPVERGTERDSVFNKKTISSMRTITGREVNTRGTRYVKKNEHSRKQKGDVYKAPL